MRARTSLTTAYFEQMYAGTPDPWGFETSAYEKAKYEHTVSALNGRRYERALEIGCANGVLTQKLSGVCNDLLAIDVSDTALASARKRCASAGIVRFASMSFPAELPDERPFDLIVLSEVAYYWDDADLARAAQTLLKLMASGGDLILVHWTGDTDYPQSGDAAVEALQRAMVADIETIQHERRPEYRLDLWRRRPV